MNSSIANIRTDYTQKVLDISDVLENPIEQFQIWFKEALHAAVMEPNAMQLSTIGLDNTPNNRVVLLKDIHKLGFTFYTNYESTKGQELIKNPFAALTFFWPELERQVRVKGVVSKVTTEESDTYFASRPRGSQIGAWVSNQSQVIADRSVLSNRQEELEKEFDGKSVPRPAHWGGFQVIPLQIEFWQGRSSRLHDRILYQRESADGTWKIERISP